MLEDSTDDAVYIQKTLQRSNLQFEALVVSSKTDFIAGLQTFSPDLIISDHQLPQFTSTEALRICKENSPLLPFILVSGAASEEFAASIIKAGADDYLLKNNLKRLPTAIAQAMEKRNTLETLQRSKEDKKLAERNLQAAHERLLFHLENTPLGYIEWDNKLTITSWSTRAEQIFGWKEEELVNFQKDGFKLIYKDDMPQANEVIQQLLKGTVERNKAQNRNYTKDGRVIWCEWFNSVMKNKSGEVIAIMSLVQDITSQKTFEEILKEYNDRYQILSKATNDAIWDWDIEHDFELWNHGIQTIFGYTEREIISTKKWWKEKIHSDDYARVNEEISQAFKNKDTNWTSQYRYLCADGSFKHVLDRGYIIYHENKPVRMIGAMQDITAQKDFVAEIEKLSLVASKTNNAVVITDAEERIEWVNDGFMNLTGYLLSEVKGLTPGQFLQGPETNKVTVKRIAVKVRNRESFTEEILNYSKKGRKYWLRMDLSPVFDRTGELKHYISIQTDISAQKEFENQITNIARDLSNLIENANVPIFGIDRAGYITEWNLIATELSGYNKNEILNKKLITLLEQAEQEKMNIIFGNVFTGEATRNYELPLLNKNGNRLILLISISPRMDVDRNIYGAICVGQDITELFHYRQGLEKIVEERTKELHEALQKEKELVELKSKFVSIASHEFRTPLSTISLIAGILQKHREKIPGDEYNTKLETIEKQVRHMTYLLDDILTIGKADAGKIITTYSTVSIAQFFTQTAREVEENSGTHKIRLKLNCTIKDFKVDEKLLRNILINLLTNAVKFSSLSKTVYLTVSHTSSMLNFDVEDKGIGISEQDLSAIFTAFQRGGNVGTIQGTGLGLSIVKKAVELLKGEIKVRSRLGSGTTFTVALPLNN